MSPRAAWRLESLGFSEVYDYKSGKADWLALGLPTAGRIATVPRAGDVARQAPTCGLGERMHEVTERVEGQGWDVCVVVNAENVVLGLHRARHLDRESDRRVEDRMVRAPTTFRPNVSVEKLLGFMRDHELDAVPITTSEGKLVGLLMIEDAERVTRDARGADET
jgi:CBS domain-containing protein